MRKVASWIVAGVVGLLMLEIVTNMCRIGRCEVHVSVAVTTRDGKPPVGLSVAYRRGEPEYRKLVTDLVFSEGRGSFTVPMRTDLAGGVVTYLIAGGLRPWYRIHSFRFTADGYQTVEVAGSGGRLVKAASDSGSPHWSLLLPEVILERAESTTLSNYRLKPTDPRVTPLAQGRKRRATRPAA